MDEMNLDDEGAEDDLRPEYDLAQMTNAIRGKYVERYKAGVESFVIEDATDPKCLSD
jgi:hypothetical protein